MFLSVDDGGDCLENEDCPQLLAHQAAGTGNVPLLMEAVNHDPSALESQDEKGQSSAPAWQAFSLFKNLWAVRWF